MKYMKEESKRPPLKHQTRTNPELSHACEGIIPWYQEEVYGLAKSMSDEMDKMIIEMSGEQ